jgi:hypothetical protein
VTDAPKHMILVEDAIHFFDSNVPSVSENTVGVHDVPRMKRTPLKLCERAVAFRNNAVPPVPDLTQGRRRSRLMAPRAVALEQHL